MLFGSSFKFKYGLAERHLQVTGDQPVWQNVPYQRPGFGLFAKLIQGALATAPSSFRTLSLTIGYQTIRHRLFDEILVFRNACFLYIKSNIFLSLRVLQNQSRQLVCDLVDSLLHFLTQGFISFLFDGYIEKSQKIDKDRFYEL